MKMFGSLLDLALGGCDLESSGLASVFMLKLQAFGSALKADYQKTNIFFWKIY